MNIKILIVGFTAIIAGGCSSNPIHTKPVSTVGDIPLSASDHAFTWDGRPEYQLTGKVDFNVKSSVASFGGSRYMLNSDIWVDGVSNTNKYSDELSFDINARSSLRRYELDSGSDIIFIPYAETNGIPVNCYIYWNGTPNLDSINPVFRNGRTMLTVGNDSPGYVTKLRITSSNIAWEERIRKDNYLYGKLIIKVEHEPVLFTLGDKRQGANVYGGSVSGKTGVAVISVRVPSKKRPPL